METRRESNLSKPTTLVAAFALAGLACMSPMRVLAQSALGESLGTVNFPISCRNNAIPPFERGVAALHHMMYSSARRFFTTAATADAECAIARWGIAMTYIHPLWPDRPTPNEIAIGRRLVDEAVAIGGNDDRENAYVDTVVAYFDAPDDSTERDRLERFGAAWRHLCQRYPGDIEAKAFCALALLATADATDKTYVKQLAAGASVEQILLEISDHPGAHHYIIHAYDFPTLAERALPVARNYGRVAPAVSHALHMMTHIFTRQGLWDESIEWNRRSADAALETSKDIGALSIHYLHALDYLAYAYLQQGDDVSAHDVVVTAAALMPPFEPLNQDAGAYAFAAIPARYALERRDWARATRLELRAPKGFPWNESQSQYRAITHFARAMGLAHTQSFLEAAEEIETLARIADELRTSSPYWATQVDIQRLSASAWLDYLRGRPQSGVATMQRAVEFEFDTSKHPVTPGEVLPAAELLGDMLLDAGRYAAALAAYDASLLRSPARLNSTIGAARAARALGDRSRAAGYYRRLVKYAPHSPREAIHEAIEYIDALSGARAAAPTSLNGESPAKR